MSKKSSNFAPDLKIINILNIIVMKRITLKELNSKGQLIAECKQFAFVEPSFSHPSPFKGGPIAVYLHYYNDMFIVTSHVSNHRQLQFYDYKDASIQFSNFLDIISI